MERGYVRPELSEGGPIEIAGGRHPVVEPELPAGAFVPNDCSLGGAADVIVITGPNMGGKSTYLRQTALIVLLAQCGCYVPAERARIAMVDRIFSRVGAQDDIAAGQSTFMVEMLETASILHNATERSLLLLDEIGRGTSTHDGLAIARAVIEHLHHRPGGTPRTLFATHYQELVALARTLPRVENRSLAVVEQGGEVVFLHRIVEGGADRSYGVHVAALAGLPRAVVARARELLRELERQAPPAQPDGRARGAAAAAGRRPRARAPRRRTRSSRSWRRWTRTRSRRWRRCNGSTNCDARRANGWRWRARVALAVMVEHGVGAARAYRAAAVGAGRGGARRPCERGAIGDGGAGAGAARAHRARRRRSTARGRASSRGGRRSDR